MKRPFFCVCRKPLAGQAVPREGEGRSSGQENSLCQSRSAVRQLHNRAKGGRSKGTTQIVYRKQAGIANTIWGTPSEAWPWRAGRGRLPWRRSVPASGGLARGVAPEALQAAMGFPVDAAAVKRIERRHGLRMPNSKKRREECGRQREGVRRSPDRNNQGVCGARMRCFKSGMFVERAQEGRLDGRPQEAAGPKKARGSPLSPSCAWKG